LILKVIRCEDEDWIQLAQDEKQWRALVNTVMNVSVPLKFENFQTT
jgi:hypothetical protein